MSTAELTPEALPAQRGGAKALMLTVLGEFVLPRGGAAWTSSLVGAAGALDIGEKNARQAVARIGEQGLFESERHGRTVRWSLTESGRTLLETGTDRIYSFGRSAIEWSGEWLVAHCPVPEQQRALRNRLRSQLGFLGFGELSPSLLVSPHLHRRNELQRLLAELDLLDDSIILRSSAVALEGGAHERDRLDGDRRVVARAWPLDELVDAYQRFVSVHSSVEVSDGESAFRALVELVHDWRRFPFADPELPTELLPEPWAGARAVELFHDRHDEWSHDAQRWFDHLEYAN